jgi:nitronate monooxygenase
LRETSLKSEVREEILTVTDGGQVTVRSRVWDEIWGTSPWLETYDERGLRNAMSDDYKSGVGIAEVQKQFYQNTRTSQIQESSMKEVSTIWAELGTGIVREFQIAGSIPNEVRATIKDRVQV